MAGDMFKINVSKLYIALVIALIFLTNHVITNGRPPQELDPNMINIRQMMIDPLDGIAKR